ncbi:unnamed protein product [Sphagnum jensenii]|uniref:Uncharacterized protein n=1 Tax=Sphagnum jensenii TaxID=128206 RepID=A0ABP0WMN3_9BRYO
MELVRPGGDGHLRNASILVLDPFGHLPEGKVTVSLEGLSIVQQHTPVAKGVMMKYTKNMAAWVVCERIKEVILISGLDSSNSQIQYISTASKDGSDGCCEVQWKLLEQYLPLGEAWQRLDQHSAEGLKVVCVLNFCAEGDNVPDAFLIGDAVQQYLYHRKPGASGMVFPSHFPQQSDGMLIENIVL